MSTGIPVLCTDVGSMGEIIHQGKTGYLFRVGDFQELAQRLLELLQNEPLRKQMGEQAKKLVHETLTVRHMAEGFEKLFLTILERQK